MDTAPMPDEVFDRLTNLERAQFLSASAQRRHIEALDRHQGVLDDHARRMAHLEAMLARQQDLQAQMLAVQATLATRQDDHAARMTRLEEISAKLQLTLDAVLALLRHQTRREAPGFIHGEG